MVKMLTSFLTAPQEIGKDWRPPHLRLDNFVSFKLLLRKCKKVTKEVTQELYSVSFKKNSSRALQGH